MSHQRLFVAVWPDAKTIELLRRLPLAAPSLDGVRLVPLDLWHVTLRFLGDVDAAIVVERLGDARLPRCDVRLGPRTIRLGRQIVISAAGVEPLAESVREATAGIGAPDDREFLGHLTLARTKSDAGGGGLLDLPAEGDFTADAVALVSSELRPTGPVYTTLATFATIDEGNPV